MRLKREKAVVSHLAKLMPVQVRKVWELYNRGERQVAIAKRLHVSQSTISNLLAGRVYRKVLKAKAA